MQQPPCARTALSEPPIEQREWISSRDALKLVMDAYTEHDCHEYCRDEEQRWAAQANAIEAIMRRLANGSLAARPVAYEFGYFPPGEWDMKLSPLNDPEGIVPASFWTQLEICRRNGTQDWVAGDFSFSSDFEAETDYRGHAYGVEFDRAGLPAVSCDSRKDTVVSLTQRGAKRKWDWDGALCHLAARAHTHPDGLLREDGSEPNQSDIGRILRDWFIGETDSAPEDSQLRSYGARMLAAVDALKCQAAMKSEAA